MGKGKNVERRKDTSPERGEHRYGNVEFADPTNKKYPIDNAEHVRAAWSYINHPDNASKYSHEDLSWIKDRIKRAAERHGVEISDEARAI